MNAFSVKHKEFVKRSVRPFCPPKNLLTSLEAVKDPMALLLRWHNRGHVGANWGDKLNPHLVAKVSGRNVYNYYDVLVRQNMKRLSAIGSSLGSEVDAEMEIWGTGFLRRDQRPLVAPRRICAVRGPMTREVYLRHGIDCPPVYGDPALLCRKYYTASENKNAKLGFIPQWRDKRESIVRYFETKPGCKVIDIQGSIHEVIAEVTSCEAIASTSLHGLVVADSFGIPAVWARVSHNMGSDYFKFVDYHGGIGLPATEPFWLSTGMTVSEIQGRACVRQVSDEVLERLLEAFPHS